MYTTSVDHGMTIYIAPGRVRHGPVTIRLRGNNDVRVIKMRYDHGQLVGRWAVVTDLQVIHGYIGESPAFVFTTDKPCEGRRGGRAITAYFITGDSHHDSAAHVISLGAGDGPLRYVSRDSLTTTSRMPIANEPESALVDIVCAMVPASRPLRASLLEVILTEVGLADWFVSAACPEHVYPGSR